MLLGFQERLVCAFGWLGWALVPVAKVVNAILQVWEPTKPNSEAADKTVNRAWVSVAMESVPVGPCLSSQAVNDHIAQKALDIADLVSAYEHLKFVCEDL